jgi:hypothetical protein
LIPANLLPTASRSAIASAADITALVAVELIAVTALVVAAIGFDFLAPLILNS